MKKIICLILATGFLWAGCKKNEDHIEGIAEDIYLAGSEVNSAGKSVARFWRNGVGFNLSDGTSNAQANSIFVSGEDIYVAGVRVNAAGVREALYWKNGIPVVLSDGITHATAFSIFVQGNDVYVCGSSAQDSCARYWKNGEETLLSTVNDSTDMTFVSSIFVSGQDVYVTGKERFFDYDRGKYWKNGVGVPMGNRWVSDASSIYVDGQDVYVGGYEYQHFGYWKNNSWNALDTIIQVVPMPSAIVGAGSNICIAGTVQNRAAYWQNGVRKIIGDPGSTSIAFAMAVAGNDVYVVGAETPIGGMESTTKLWKNGVPIVLKNGVSEFYIADIFVK